MEYQCGQYANALYTQILYSLMHNGSGIPIVPSSHKLRCDSRRVKLSSFGLYMNMKYFTGHYSIAFSHILGHVFDFKFKKMCNRNNKSGKYSFLFLHCMWFRINEFLFDWRRCGHELEDIIFVRINCYFYGTTNFFLKRCRRRNKFIESIISNWNWDPLNWSEEWGYVK